MKQQSPQEQLKELVAELLESFNRWEYLFKFGGSDPSWSDGCNMELVKNHIIYYKQQMHDLCEQNRLELPPEYYKGNPPEVDRDYMARTDEIRKNAVESLKAYKQGRNYQSLCKILPSLDKKQINQTCIANVIGYVKGLEKAISKDDLITMRRHERPERYISSFSDCLERASKAKTEFTGFDNDGQMIFFDVRHKMKTQESTYRHFTRLIRDTSQRKDRNKSKCKKNLKRKKG